MKKIFFSLIVITFTLMSCKKQEETTKSGLLKSKFTAIVNGDSTGLYVLKNTAGMEVCITNFGARIVSIMVPDRRDKMQDVVLGFDNIADYIHIPSAFGASIGRYANRINQGKFSIDGKTIQLPQNNAGHCLHGGPKGWQYQVYKNVKQIDAATIEMTRFSPDGDMNFPGNVQAKVKFKLTVDNAIEINFEAITDKKTVINMCNHSFFNLSGNANNKVLKDILYINANSYTPVDSTQITLGTIDSVKNTPLDFRIAKTIGRNINESDFIQLKQSKGYDHNWVLNTAGNVAKLAAKVSSPLSGITLEVYTTEPGIQVYTGNSLNGTIKGKKGIVYKQYSGICLETQHYPDSPNKPQWPSVILEPGKIYKSTCIYKFGVER